MRRTWPRRTIIPISSIEWTGRTIATGAWRTGAWRAILFRLIKTRLNFSAAHHRSVDLSEHELGDCRRHFHDGMRVAHFHPSDLRSGNAGFRRDRGNHFLRANAVLFAEVHEEALHRAGMDDRRGRTDGALLLEHAQSRCRDLDPIELLEQWLEREHLAAYVARGEHVTQGRTERGVLAACALRGFYEADWRYGAATQQHAKASELRRLHEGVQLPRPGADQGAHLLA